MKVEHKVEKSVDYSLVFFFAVLFFAFVLIFNYHIAKVLIDEVPLVLTVIVVMLATIIPTTIFIQSPLPEPIITERIVHEVKNDRRKK